MSASSGRLVDRNATMAPPADSHEPRSCSCHRGWAGARCHNVLPSGEPGGGRARIHPASGGCVLPNVVEHVHQRVPYLPRRLEIEGVEAITPHATTTAQG